LKEETGIKSGEESLLKKMRKVLGYNPKREMKAEIKKVCNR